MGSRLEANSSYVRKRIEAHKFENEEGEEYEGSKFGGFADYFRRKKIKLQNLDAQRRSSSDNPPIFRGVVAHVNGYTQPSLNDLHSMITSYGGGFLQYLDGKTAATHIIASSLTPKKRVDFRKYRIVKPSWVVDSIKTGRLLPWSNYKLLDEGIGQQILGHDSGGITSQVNSQHTGYRDQTDTSWYTEQVRSIAESLDERHPQRSSLENDIETDDDRKDSVNETLGGHSDSNSIESYDAVESEQRSPNSLGAQALFSDVKPSDSSEELDLIRSESVKVGVPEAQDFPTEENASESAQRITERSPISENHVSSSREQSIKPLDKSKMTAEDHNAVLLADPKKWKSTAVNPEFLKQYYEESRLHHLSAWKAELKSKLQALAAEKTSSQKSREKRPLGSRRYILHVDFDCFFAAVSLKKYPQYIDKPVAIAHGDGSGSEIASCNYPARKFGIKNGMWMRSAQQLCPDLKVLPYDFKAYEDASQKFYSAIMDTDGIVQSVSIDEALVDISIICIAAGGQDGKGTHEGSIQREQGKADDVAQALRNEIKTATGCQVSVGIGSNILLAKVALKKAKPAGQYHVKPEEALEFLGALSVQDLPGVAHSIGGKLEEIGVKLVKDVRDFPKDRLMSTLGPKTGQKIWDYSRGIDRAEVGDQVIRKSVSAEVNWGIRFVTQDQADEFVQSLCDELHKRLVNEKVKGRQLTLKVMKRAADAPLDPPKHMGHGKCDTFNKSVVLGVATNENQILGREAILILRGWGFSPGELRGIGVQMTKLEPFQGASDGSVTRSQKRLQFATSTSPKYPTFKEETLDDLESPPKPQIAPPHPAAAFSTDTSPSGKSRQPLNTLGTQFMLPSQVDPEVLAELPADIKAKVVPKRPAKLPFQVDEKVSDARSRVNSPSLPVNPLPSQSQIDQETLDALPTDVRAEILAFYEHSSPKAHHGQQLLPQSPRKVRATTTAAKKVTTPTKKRGGLGSRGRGGARLASTSTSTLTQSNFVAHRPLDAANDAAPASSEVSAEFLSALPEDIRREVLDQARRERLKQRGGIDIVGTKIPKPPRPAPPPAGQRLLHLPPAPPHPTFTARKLSSLPDLRDAVNAWFAEFRTEGPHPDDVDALRRYLTKVAGPEEGDMAKAVSVVRWLQWLIGDASGDDTGLLDWTAALSRLEEGVQEAVTEKGLGRVDFGG